MSPTPCPGEAPTFLGPGSHWASESLAGAWEEPPGTAGGRSWPWGAKWEMTLPCVPVCTRMCACVYMCVHVGVCIHVRMYVCVHVRAHVWTCVCLCTCVFVYMWGGVRVCVAGWGGGAGTLLAQSHLLSASSFHTHTLTHSHLKKQTPAHVLGPLIITPRALPRTLASHWPGAPTHAAQMRLVVG